MKQLVDDDLECVRVVMQAVAKDVGLPVASGTLWNYGSRNPKTSLSRLPDHMQPGYRTYPQIARDAIRNLLRALHRHTLGRLRRDG